MKTETASGTRTRFVPGSSPQTSLEKSAHVRTAVTGSPPFPNKVTKPAAESQFVSGFNLGIVPVPCVRPCKAIKASVGGGIVHLAKLKEAQKYQGQIADLIVIAVALC